MAPPLQGASGNERFFYAPSILPGLDRFGYRAIEGRDKTGRSSEMSEQATAKDRERHGSGISPLTAYAAAAVALVVVVLFAVTTVQINRSNTLAEARFDVADEVGQLRSALEGNIYLNVNLIQGLAAAVATE
ncbi:MAG: hypothetical protein RLN70_08925, partial [Rhodospirillaceae bacterium]